MGVPKWKLQRNKAFRDALNELAQKHSATHHFNLIKTTSPPTVKALQTLHAQLDRVLEEESEDGQALKSAAIDWESAEAPADEPQDGGDADDEEQGENEDGVAPGEYRMHGLAFMCTYNSAHFTDATWDDFVLFTRQFNLVK